MTRAEAIRALHAERCSVSEIAAYTESAEFEVREQIVDDEAPDVLAYVRATTESLRRG